MKLRGITSVLAASVAVGLVAMVGASGEQDALEAVPAPSLVEQNRPAPPRPAPGVDEARDAVEDAFGHQGVDPEINSDNFDFADPLGMGPLAHSKVLSAQGTIGFNPFDAPTPEVVQPDGAEPPATQLPVPSAPSTIPTTTVESVGVEREDALLSQPVNGRSTSRFGMRFHPVLRVWKLHTGHDWAAPCGTPVGAAAAGIVVRTGWAGGNGVQVKIDHGQLGGYRVVTTYNHLSSIGVKVGQKVNALQGIGRVGTTGYSTGCHLHFEVIANGQFTDPLPWLNGRPGQVDLSQMNVVPTLPQSPDASATPSPTDSLEAPAPGETPLATTPPAPTTEAPPAPKPGETIQPSPEPTQPGKVEAPPPTTKPVIDPTTPPAETPTETDTPDVPETTDPPETTEPPEATDPPEATEPPEATDPPESTEPPADTPDPQPTDPSTTPETEQPAPVDPPSETTPTATPSKTEPATTPPPTVESTTPEATQSASSTPTEAAPTATETVAEEG